MTRAFTCCAVGGLLVLAACGSPDDGGTNTTSRTGSGASGGTGGASAGGAGGSGGQGAAGSGGSGVGGVGGAAGKGGSGAGAGAGGATTGGAGSGGATGGAGKGGTGGSTAGAAGTAAGAGGSGAAAGAGGSAGARDGGSTGGTAGTPGTDGGRDASVDAPADTPTTSDAGGTQFSFFVVSMKALQTLSGNVNGFGGDLRFGQADGLAGADEICRQAAETAAPGAGSKTWRAFLSVSKGPAGTPVNARDRIGSGPWYDRSGRLLAANVTDLFAGARPKGDPALINDMTNERGEPNHYVGAGGYTPGSAVDNHDTLTGSDAMGNLRAPTMADTCNDWTSTTVTAKPWIGHSWPRSASSGLQWASDHSAPGCVPGVDRTLGGTGTGACVGCSGGYGGFYCFAVP